MRQISRWFFLLVIGLGSVLVLSQQPTLAQCSVRTDWQLYTVQRGDTLSRIARRNGISTAALMQGNCLTSTRILAGQSLRVPTGGNPVSSPLNVSANYQVFERGVIIWRADTSTIYVLANDGQARTYPASVYSRLPDNPRPNPPRSSSTRPLFGIGKVWGNFDEVLNLVGQPTSSEFSYMALTNTTADGFYFTHPITHPSGQVIIIRSTTWAWVPSMIPTPIPRILGTPVPSPTPAPPMPTPAATLISSLTTWAAYQSFEGGFMIWRQDTGQVYVFIGYNGMDTLRSYDASVYNAWTAPSDPPPTSRFAPVNAFGKVWSQHRDQLGWGLAQEQGYTATVNAYAFSAITYLHITLPTGQTVFANPGRLAWSWVN